MNLSLGLSMLVTLPAMVVAAFFLARVLPNFRLRMVGLAVLLGIGIFLVVGVFWKRENEILNLVASESRQLSIQTETNRVLMRSEARHLEAIEALGQNLQQVSNSL